MDMTLREDQGDKPGTAGVSHNGAAVPGEPAAGGRGACFLHIPELYFFVLGYSRVNIYIVISISFNSILQFSSYSTIISHSFKYDL